MSSDLPGKNVATIEVAIPSALSRYADRQTSLAVGGRTIDEVFENLWEKYPRLRSRIVSESGQLYPHLILLRNQQRLTGEAVTSSLSTGDKLEIVSLAGGG